MQYQPLQHLFQVRQIIWREYRAVCSMLLRSGFSTSDLSLARVLSTNLSRGFHTSTPNGERKQNEKDDKKDDKKDEESESTKFLQVMAKTLTYFVVFLFITSLFAPNTSRGPSQVGLVTSS